MKQITGSARTVKRARRLADLLMQEMYAGLRQPEKLLSEEWDKLFGAKQSMIANLQKLVSTLAALSEPEMTSGKIHKNEVLDEMSKAEMAMLKAWLAQEGD